MSSDECLKSDAFDSTRPFNARHALEMAQMLQNAYVVLHEQGASITPKLRELLARVWAETSQTEEDLAYIQAARAQFASDGKLEVSDNAVVSYGDDPGAYVQAYVWVYASSLGAEGSSTNS